MYRVALDILPVQASSVACERVFSLSKETITMRRNRLSVELMEILNSSSMLIGRTVLI